MTALLQRVEFNLLTDIVGWTLVHFLWQGLSIAALAAIALVLLRSASASARYMVACGSLALMAIAPIVTSSWLAVTTEGSREPQTTQLTAHLNGPLQTNSSQHESSSNPAGDVSEKHVNSSSTANVSPQLEELSSTGIAWRKTLRTCFPFLVVFWSAGASLLSLRLLGGLWRVHRWRQLATAIELPELMKTTALLASKIGLNRKFELLESAQASVPAVMGWLKPAVIVPASLISGLTPAELESLLAHELAHIRRHDYLVNLMQTVIETVLFYHPAVWWLSGVIRSERENCCDDIAVIACGNRIAYVRALTKMEELRCGHPELALSAKGGSLLGRVQRLVAPSMACRTNLWPSGVLVFSTIVLLLSSLFIGAAIAQSDSENQPEVARALENRKQEVQEARAGNEKRVKRAALPLTVVEKDNDVIKRIELKAIAKGRSAKELWRKWTSIRHVTGGPGVSITDFETLVSASQNARWLDTTVDADEIVFGLPEGSKMRAEFFGDKVEVIEDGNKTLVVVTNGKVNLLDQGGVVRAWASADSGAEQTIAEVSFQQQEFILRLKARRLVDDPKHMPNMQCATFPETGGPKDEEQSPHGAVRYEVKEDKEKNEFLLRISWRYDVDRIRLEAESAVESPSSSSSQPPITNRSADDATPIKRKSAPFKLPMPSSSGDSVRNEVPTVQSTDVVKEDADWGAVERKTGLRLRLTLAATSVLAGKPVLGKLELQNSGKQAAEYDPQSFAPFRVVLVADEKGNAAQFIGPRPQTSGAMLELAPGESVTLWEDVDLSELYLLDSGTYEVIVVSIDRQRDLALVSRSIRLKVDEGQLAPKLQLLKQLRSIAPAEWGVSTSFGAIYLSHSPTNLKQDVTTIQLWFTDEPLPADYKLGNGNNRQRVATIAPTELGFLHMAAPARANEIWPEHMLLIKTAAARVLNFSDKPGDQIENELDKEKNPNDQVNELPWRAKGRVTDRDGNPLAGVTVRAHCGIGSLMPTGETVTNDEGNYELQFGPGIFSSNRKLVQAATISVSLDGHFEKNLYRQGDLLAAFEKPEGADLGWGGKTIEDLFLPGEPKTIDFVMLPATKFAAVVIGKDGDRLDGVSVSLTGPDLPPSCSVVAQTQTDKGGRFELTNLPTGFAFQFLIKPAKKQSRAVAWASPPLKLEPYERGHNCFSTEYKGHNLTYRIQELSIQLDSNGKSWKDALASAARQNVLIQIDGFDKNDKTNIRFNAGKAKMVLGAERVTE